MPATFATIDDVLTQLDAIIATARQRGTADGYFAALYRRVTAQVKAGIAQGLFADGARMARFDVIFARRYVEAWLAHERGDKTSESWAVAFASMREDRPVVIQHLLVGMNAHINLDLGIAAAEVSPGEEIDALKGDFDEINRVLASLVNDVQDRLSQMWPEMKILDRLGGGLDEKIVSFNIDTARVAAWTVAKLLASEPDPDRRAAHIARIDQASSLLGRGVLNPGLQAAAVLAVVRLRERGSIADKIDILTR